MSNYVLNEKEEANMSICAWCKVKACTVEDRSNKPQACPMDKGEWSKDAMSEYARPENRKLAQMAAHIEKTGYCQWTRLQEIAEYASYAGFSKLGLAFCRGLGQEAQVVADYLKKKGFDIVSATCSIGGIDKDVLGIAKEDRFNPDGFEPMCNPIGQAKLCNENHTHFNVVLGLCVGHDSLFFKYSEAPTTVLAAKDRVLGHNPLAAVYCANSYYRRLHY